MVGAVEDGGGAVVEVAVEAASRNQNKRAPGVVPNIRIFPKASGKGAICIIAGGKVHIGVKSREPVPGKTTGLQRILIENLTSLNLID